MANRESSPGISPAKKRIRYRSGSNFNAEYTRTFDWVMSSDRGKQQAYCKVCSKHFSVSHGGIDDVEGKKHLELFNGFLKKITDFPRVVPHFFFQKLNMSVFINSISIYWSSFKAFVGILMILNGVYGKYFWIRF